MLQSLKELYGKSLGGVDCAIGHVKDFYFDDQNWAVRYVVADTGSWLPGRKVLIAPHAFGPLHQASMLLLVNLTRKQIEDSPSIDSHKPVSRQYEEEYYRHHGWPCYWNGAGLWGPTGFPGAQGPALAQPTATGVVNPQARRSDAHLRSSQAVAGYLVQTNHGTMGHVCDFRVDPQSWAILEVVVRTGNRFSGEDVPIPTSQIDRISYEDSTIFVTLPAEAVDKLLAADAVPIAAL